MQEIAKSKSTQGTLDVSFGEKNTLMSTKMQSKRTHIYSLGKINFMTALICVLVLSLVQGKNHLDSVNTFESKKFY